MTRSSFLAAAAVLTGLLASAQTGPRQDLKKPKLVVGIVIDQFRYDYLTRFRQQYTGAFARFYHSGAIYTNAHYEHFPTVTAIGHSTFMSGATPAISGIVGNAWFDRATGANVTSVSDPGTELLGAPGKGSSPNRLLVSTVGDELKMAGRKNKVIGISIKDRSAILPAGHMADGAFWFDGTTGNFVSSTFYFPDLPGWVKDFNAQHPADKYANAVWKAFDSDKVYKTMPAGGKDLYNGLEAAPFGNALIEEFTERAIEAEQLGRHADTDLLTVSFSANDYVGHAVGPDDPMVRDISVRTDQLLDKFLKFVESKVGVGNVLFVLTADHGIAPTPEVNKQRKMPGGRATDAEVTKVIQDALTEKYGEGKWILAHTGPSPYFDRELIKRKKLDIADVERTAADAVRDGVPSVWRVYTKDEIIKGQMIQDRYSQRVRNGFYPQRGADLIVVAQPYWVFDARGASHGMPFNYDTHVPIIFMGPNIRAGRYDSQVAVNDIAPTLATMLEVETPSGAVGRVLSEMFAPSASAQH